MRKYEKPILIEEDIEITDVISTSTTDKGNSLNVSDIWGNGK